MIEKNLNLIRNIAWSYHKTNPAIEFDDLFSEGCIAYLEAEKNFNPNYGTKKTSYIWMCMQSHLNNITKRENKINQWISPVIFEEIFQGSIYSLEDTPSSTSYQPEKCLMAKEAYASLFNTLSPMAQELIESIQNGLGGYLPIDTPKLCRGAIKDALRKQGWSWANIWDTFREIKMTLA